GRLAPARRRVRVGLVGRLLPRVLVPLAGWPRLLLGFAPRLASLFLRAVADLPGVLQCLVTCLAGLLEGLVPRQLALTPRLAPGLPRLRASLIAHVPRRPAGFASRPGQLLAQAAHGLPDVFPDLADDVADRSGQFFFQLVQLVAAAAQFLAPRLGDPVDLASLGLVVGDQAFFLQP